MFQLSQFSFVLALALFAASLIWSTWSRPRWRPVGILAAVVLVAAWWLVLRPGAAGSATAGTVSQALAAGRPVVVEVYSDY